MFTSTLASNTGERTNVGSAWKILELKVGLHPVAWLPACWEHVSCLLSRRQPKQESSLPRTMFPSECSEEVLVERQRQNVFAVPKTAKARKLTPADNVPQ